MAKENEHGYKIISADGHTIEPPYMWERYLPKKFHPQMPRLVEDPDGGDAWEVIPGQPVIPIGLVTNRGEWVKTKSSWSKNSTAGSAAASVAHNNRQEPVEASFHSVPPLLTMGPAIGQPPSFQIGGLVGLGSLNDPPSPVIREISR